MAMRYVRRWMVVGSGALSTALGACQLVSGLSGYHETGGAGGTTTHTTSTTQGTGGVTTTSHSAGGGGAGGSLAIASASAASSSSGGSCTGGLESCPGAGCVDVASDPHHCGTCTTDCVDPVDNVGSCTNGACVAMPVLLAGAKFDSITAISANDSGAFWTGKQGSTSILESHVAPGWVPMMQNLMFDAGGLAVLSGGDTAYLSATTSIASSTNAVLYQVKPPMPPTSLDSTHGAGLGPAGMMALPSDSQVFWVAQNGPSCLGDDIKTVGTALTVSPVVTQKTKTTRLLLAAAQDAVYYDDSLAFWKVSASQTTASQIITPVTSGDPLFLAVDPAAAYIYWIDQGSGAPVLKRASTTGAVDQGSYTVTSPQGLAATNDTVFWIDGSCNSGSSAIKVARWGPMQATILLGGLACPQNLTLGGKYLYYSDANATGERQVYRIVHP